MSLELKRQLAAYLGSMMTPRRRELFQRVLAQRTRFLTVVLEDVADPLDACAVMRSCDCFGIQDLHIVSQHTPFRLSPGVAVGSSKWLSFRRWSSARNQGGRGCMAFLKDSGYRVAAVTTRPGSVPIHELELDQKLALCFGGEDFGLSESIYGAADVLATIPTRGFIRHFNLSLCVALCIADLRERLAREGVAWSLNETERLDLQLLWSSRMLRKTGEHLRRFATDRALDTERVLAAMPQI